MNDRLPAARQAGLLVVAFVATIVLLAGGRAWLAQVDAGRPTGSPQSALGGGGSPSIGPITPAPSLPTIKPDPSGDTPVVLLGAGDIADCAQPGAAQTSDLLLGLAGSIFTAGNNAYPDGSAANYTDCYGPTWGRVLDRTILPTAGNHDWVTPGAAGYLGYFGAAAAPQGVTWYSTDLGAWHIVVLDSDCAMVGGCDDTSPQGRWLKHDLAVSTAHCTLAIWNQPRFSSGPSGNDPDVGPFWDQLHEAQADLIVNAHDLDYERFAPQDPAGRVERPGGLREIVIGTGGAGLGSFKAQAPNSEFRAAGVHGILRLTLHAANYDWEFLPVGSDIADSGSTPCR
jgi:hypothetical protein